MSDYPNIIVIVLDTLRKDVMPMYGGKAITPNLNKFSQDATVFQNAIAPASWTVPSHVSLFTGLYPERHGVHEDFEVGSQDTFRKLHKFKANVITKRLEDFGYSTFGLSANGNVSPGTGFEKFFNHLSYISNDYSSSDYRSQIDEILQIGKSKTQVFKNSLMKGKVREVIRFYRSKSELIKKRRRLNYPLMKGSDNIIETVKNSHYETPFFLFLNFTEVHEPLCKWEFKDLNKNLYDLLGFKKINVSRIRNVRVNYEKALNNLDKQIGRLFHELKQKKMYEGSLIIVTSDHGQSMKENRKFPYYGHGNFVYDELTQIPLIVKFPKRELNVKNQNYQSLTKIPELIEHVFEGSKDIDISERAVFSESFGWIEQDFPKLVESRYFPKSTNIKEIKNRFFYPRKAVYKGGYKLTLNQLNEEIDEFLCNGKEVPPKDNKTIVEDLKDEIRNSREH